MSFDEKVFIMFKILVFHPFARVESTRPAPHIQKYEIYLESLKMIELTYNNYSKEYNLWRNDTLLYMYQERDIPTDILPDYEQLRLMIQNRIAINTAHKIKNVSYSDLIRIKRQ